MRTPFTQHRIKSCVGSLAVFEKGAGTPVLMWPSLFSDHRLYSHVVGLMGIEWRALCIDGPGFGQSDAPIGEVQSEVYADAVLEVLDRLGIEKTLVAGCSWGGQIAAHVGVKAPDRVKGILIMNSPLGPSLGGHLFEVLGTRCFGSTAFWGKGVARSMFSEASRRQHPERVREFIASFQTFDRKNASTTVHTVLTRFPGLQSVLSRLAIPTTILMGAEDKLYSPDKMLSFAHLAIGAKIEIIPECGHLAPLEAPECVVECLRELRSRASK